MSHTDPDAWRTKEYSFFSHTACEYFPCHKTDHPEDFNCLFCYCPLYLLGDRCGGNFTYTAKGVKNCKNCLIPHQRKNYGYITRRLRELTRPEAAEGRANEETN